METIHTLLEAMQAAAADGVQFVAERFGKSLDYSESSVRELEATLDALAKSYPKGFIANLRSKPEVKKANARTTMMLGAYLGEVARRQFGGEWTTESAAFPKQRVLTLRTTSGIELWPNIKVEKRLVNGDEDNVWLYFQALKQHIEQSSS